MKRAAFVDRDGTLNVDPVRSADVSKLRLMPRAAEAVRLWNDAGWLVVLITNQSGVGRGLFTEEELARFHDAVRAALDRAAGARLDAIYHCPHAPVAACACRKPRAELLQRASRDLSIDAAASFMVGDTWRDVAAGQAVGARTVLVPSKPPGEDEAERIHEGQPALTPDFVARDLGEAATWTLAQPVRRVAP